MTQTLILNGNAIEFEVLARKGDKLVLSYEGTQYRFSGFRNSDGSFVLEQETGSGCWQRIAGFAENAGRLGTRLQLGALEALLAEAHMQQAADSGNTRLSPVAPMPGMVRQVMVAKGDMVTEGQPLAVIEAMKLQLTLTAGGDALVAAVLVSEGQMVAEGAELFTLKAGEG